MRDYLALLIPHRRAIARALALTLAAVGLQLLGPLFTRYIVDDVLLDEALEPRERFTALSLVSALFIVAIALSAGLPGRLDSEHGLGRARHPSGPRGPGGWP